MTQRDPKVLLNQFCMNSKKSINLLHKEKLLGQMLTVFYSSIEALGLLDAPLHQSNATGQTFQAWVKKYITFDPRVQFNEIDLWGARCGVLHTFTSESDSSKSGTAREIRYISGPKDHPLVKAFESATLEIDKGKNIPARIEDVIDVFSDALAAFENDFEEKCASDPRHAARLEKVMQAYVL